MSKDSNSNAVSAVRKALGGEHEAVATDRHLGDLVWFSIRGLEPVSRADVNAAIRGEGLYESLELEQPSAWASLGHAKQTWKRQRRPIQIDKEDRTRAKSPWLIVHKEKRHYDPLACVAVDEDTGDFLVEEIDPKPGVDRMASAPGLRDAVIEELRSGYEEHFRWASKHEVTTFVTTALLDMFGGVRLKEEGHLFWVGAEMSRADDVRAVARVVEGLPGESYMAVLWTLDQVENRDRIADRARAGFESEIEKLFVELSGAGPRVLDEKTVRESTLEDRLDTYDDLRNRIELYAGLLGQRQTQLYARLDEASRIVNDMLLGKRGQTNQDDAALAAE